MGLEDCCALIIVFMKAIGKKISLKDRGFIWMIMAILLEGFLKMGSLKGSAF